MINSKLGIVFKATILLLTCFSNYSFAQDQNNKMKKECPIANGKIIIADIPQKSFIEPMKGIFVMATDSDIVKSILNGQVAKVDSLPYHNLFMLVKSKDTTICYTGLSELFVKEGEVINKGQCIGILGSNENDQKVLYIEFWKGKTQINPNGLINCGSVYSLENK